MSVYVCASLKTKARATQQRQLYSAERGEVTLVEVSLRAAAVGITVCSNVTTRTHTNIHTEASLNNNETFRRFPLYKTFQ